MLTALPVTLLALVVSGAPWNQPSLEGAGAARFALHAALSQPSARSLSGTDVLRAHMVRPSRSAMPRPQRRVGPHSALTKLGAGCVGALLGFYVGAGVGAATDKGSESYTGVLIGGYGGAAAGAIAGVLLVR
jgi:hypothetical protein